MKATQKIASILLAGIFLFSSLGLTINSMVCLKSGKGRVSLVMIEDCCAKKKAETKAAKCCDDDMEATHPENLAVLKKGECCDINSLSLRLAEFQNPQKLSIDQPLVCQSLFYTPVVNALATAENKLSFQYSDLPPPLYGRSLLNFISLLTI